MMQGLRVELRPITNEDTNLIITWRNSPHVRNNFIDQRLFTVESHEYWLEHFVKTKKVEQFIMIEKATNRPFGSIYLRDIDREHKKAEYGIFIGESWAEHKGYATEAGQLILKYAIESLKLNRIYLRVLSENTSAIRSYEKVGFQKEGYLREDVCIQSIYKDIVWMACLANQNK